MQVVEVQKVATLSGHRDAVYTIQPSGAGNQLVFSSSGDGMVVLWNLENPSEGELIAKLPNSVYALWSLQPSGLLVAGNNYDGIHLLDWREKKELASLKITSSAIFDIQQFNNDLLLATGDGELVVVDLTSLTVKKRIKCTTSNARCMALSAERGEVAVGFSDSFIRVIDLYDYSVKREWKAHDNSVFTLQYHPATHRLLSGSRDARLKAWLPGDEYRLDKEVVAHLFALNHLIFSPDEKHFVTCSMDKTIKVWDSTNLELLKVIDKARHGGHRTSVNKLLWTTYRNQLISASDDRTLSVWELFFKLQSTATQS